MRFTLWFGALLAVLVVQSTVYAQGDVTIRWYGHAFFAVTSAEGCLDL